MSLAKLLGEKEVKVDEEKSKKAQKIGLFDFLNSIYEQKPIEEFAENSKEYSAFMINRGLAQGMDTVLLANEMNQFPSIDKDMHYRYLSKNANIRAKKRFNKWAKAAAASEDIQLIMEFFRINRSRAEEIMDLVDLDDLRKKNNKGGVNK